MGNLGERHIQPRIEPPGDGTNEMMNMMRVALAVFACFALGSQSAAQMIYWTDGMDNTIRRATFDGDDVTTLISTGLDRPDGIEIDPAGLKMYWAEQGGRIQLADLDGTNIDLLVVSIYSADASVAI